jgi:hypothetical protein
MNTNVLEGCACPGCGGEGPFIIECAVLLRVYDNGTENTDNSNTTWEDNSYCRCDTCGHEGTIALFYREPGPCISS